MTDAYIYPKTDGDTIRYKDMNTWSGVISAVEAGENVTAGNAVYIKQNDGKAYIADTGTADDARFDGFALETISSGSDVNVQTEGVFTTSSLTAAETYYLSTAGALTTTANNFIVGVAISTTELKIQKNMNMFGWSPIGSLIAWAKTLGGVPQVLPAGWIEADGTTISDTESPMNGTTVPDLAGGADFLYGAATSGSSKTEDTLSHSHNQGTLKFNINTAAPKAEFSGVGGTNYVGLISGSTGSTGSGTAWEGYSVVWIIRIK